MSASKDDNVEENAPCELRDLRSKNDRGPFAL